jgi:hypothetical protein
MWLVIQLDRATTLASDMCHTQRCWIAVALQVPTRSPYGTTYRGEVDPTGPALATIVTPPLSVGRHDFAQAYSEVPWMYFSPRGFAESV